MLRRAEGSGTRKGKSGVPVVKIQGRNLKDESSLESDGGKNSKHADSKTGLASSQEMQTRALQTVLDKGNRALRQVQHQ